MAQAFDLGLADVGEGLGRLCLRESVWRLLQRPWSSRPGWPLGGVEGGLLGQETGFELLVVEVIVFGSECFGFFAAEHH